MVSEKETTHKITFNNDQIKDALIKYAAEYTKDTMVPKGSFIQCLLAKVHDQDELGHLESITFSWKTIVKTKLTRMS